MAGKGKIVRGALDALTDVFKAGDDAPVDESKRAFIRKSPAAAVGGAGALGGLGTAAALGAKALFSQGKFDDIIAKIKSLTDEDWNFFSADEAFNTVKEKLGLSDPETVKLFDDSGYFSHGQGDYGGESSLTDYIYVHGAEKPESKKYLLEEIDDRIDNLTNEETVDSFNQLLPSALRLEIMKKFPDLDKNELDDLAKKLF
jgi:hypothetical protein